MNNWMIICSEISLIDWGINICLKSPIILLLALGLSRLFVNSAAKFHYSIWKGTFLVLILLPFVGLLPSINIMPTNQIDTSAQIISELPIPYESILQNRERDARNLDIQQPLKFGQNLILEKLVYY